MQELPVGHRLINCSLNEDTGQRLDAFKRKCAWRMSRTKITRQINMFGRQTMISWQALKLSTKPLPVTQNNQDVVIWPRQRVPTRSLSSLVG